MSFMDIIGECPKCGCPKEEVEYLNSGPIIRIRCPRCAWGMTEGVDTPPGAEALVKTWNSAREIKTVTEGRGVKLWLDDLRPAPKGYEWVKE